MMLPFSLTSFGQGAAWRAFCRAPLRWCLGLLFVLWVAGAAGFTVIDGYPLSDALYMSLTTLTTIGYGEVHPLSAAGRLFNMQFIVVAVCVVALTLALLFRLGVERLSASLRRDTPMPDVRAQVAQILDSDHFLTVLRAALPVGNADQQYGFDFIPFMLHAIDERRQRFNRSAKNFLVLTVTLGIVFSGVVFYFGYILVNESASGTGRIVADLREDTRIIRARLSNLAPALTDNTAYQQSRIPASIDQLRKRADLPADVASAVAKAPQTTADLVILRQQLQNVHPPNTQDQKLVTDLRDDLERFATAEATAAATLSADVGTLDTVLHTANDALQKPENRTADILKRIALGFIVATFLLAILRYAGGLYRDHYHQVLLAEQDDLAVRRFYVAYKCATDQSEERAKVLAAFVGGPAIQASPSDEMNSPNLPTNEIVKELLTLLTKRL